ncbi:Branched-chain amino acid transport system / permease component [Neomoorella glycerini]|uniref:Branched-chain amino acid transport system / permease component n=1 Tax=Neomoorella glycerini TaxID=55779 RepID=A0A6I5ZMT2_9FIRM|nr:ABC transporter permease [Moorella glycerini]QGP91180.1 Branched-chain amino acid transport system / permease component [Moorella glycerini]
MVGSSLPGPAPAPLITWEKRLEPSRVMAVIVPVIAVILALGVGAIFLAVTGFNPLKVYQSMLYGVIGSKYGLSETVVKAIPLMLAGLGVSVAFRMLLWNIGAEGQFYMGAFGASFVALYFPHLPAYLMLPAMFIAGIVMGGLWAVLPALPKARWGVNEVITTLMLNYVAILWVDYLVYGPWKDPKGFNFPLTAPFSKAAILPTIAGTRVHLGLIFALLAAIVLSIILWHTRWGYEIRVIGESPRAARYAGIKIERNIILVMLLSGALAGLAGMSEVAGITHRLQHGISPGYGYTAIIIAWLAKLHPATIILVSFLFGGLIVGGYSVQTSGVPAATVSMLQGAILFFVLGGEILTRYRLHFGRKEGK